MFRWFQGTRGKLGAEGFGGVGVCGSGLKKDLQLRLYRGEQGFRVYRRT